MALSHDLREVRTLGETRSLGGSARRGTLLRRSKGRDLKPYRMQARISEHGATSASGLRWASDTYIPIQVTVSHVGMTGL